MPSMSAVSLSGMAAAQSALDASAHNIANLATPGFRREHVQQATMAGLAGVASARGRAAQARTDVEADMVGQLQAKNAFIANLAVFKAADGMLGTLLDTTG